VKLSQTQDHSLKRSDVSSFVYTLFNTQNGKFYVGKANDCHGRWLRHLGSARRGSLQAIHCAIRKYGKSVFEWTVIQEFTQESDAFAAEMYWIDFFRSNEKEFGYNLTRGGAGGYSVGADIREKISRAKKGKKHTPESIAKMSKTHSERKHRKQSEETRRKIGEANRGRKHSEECRKRMSEGHKGRVVSEETRQKLRDVAARRKALKNLKTSDVE
jgi:group I intron endonuclease